MAKFNPGDKVVTFSDYNAHGHCFEIGQVVTVVSTEDWGFPSADTGTDFYAAGKRPWDDEIVIQYLPEDEFELFK